MQKLFVSQLQQGVLPFYSCELNESSLKKILRYSNFLVRTVEEKEIGEELCWLKESLEAYFSKDSETTFKYLSPTETIISVLI